MVASRLANYVVFPCSEERGQAVQLFCEVGLGGLNLNRKELNRSECAWASDTKMIKSIKASSDCLLLRLPFEFSRAQGGGMCLRQ